MSAMAVFGGADVRGEGQMSGSSSGSGSADVILRLNGVPRNNISSFVDDR